MKTVYFVRIQSFWQRAPHRWVGPFYQRGAALEAVARSRLIMPGKAPKDPREDLRFDGVYTRSQALKLGLPTMAPETMTIMYRVPNSVGEIADLEREIGAPSIAPGWRPPETDVV